MSDIPSVVIIGAGASGIAAATRLFENGIDNLTILEAENRIGGRIHSIEFDGSIVDLGGQWVHGEKGNIVYEMVKDLDLLSTSFNTYHDNTYYLSDGRKLDKNITDKLFKIGMEIMENEESALKYGGSFGSYFVNVFKEKILEQFKNDEEIIELAKFMQDWFQKFFICLDSAKSWYDISVRGAMSVFQPCEGDQLLNWRNRGFRTILDVLMKKIPDSTKQLPIEDKILLNKEVTRIEWDGDMAQTDSKATVTCGDGSVYAADHIIITTSVGVLKKFHKTLFIPEVPPYKANSIEHISLGTVNKILLKFPVKWWGDDTKGFSLLWTEEDSKNLVNDVPVFGPTDEHGRSWLEDVFGFYIIDSHPRVLLGWVVGTMAAEVEQLTDEDVMMGCMTILRKFVGNKYDIPEPDGVLRSQWNSNPHFCGSYVYTSIDQENNNASANDLAKPLISKRSNKPTVLFAGEATSSNQYSTVNGAIETGYREAQRLIQLYN